MIIIMECTIHLMFGLSNDDGKELQKMIDSNITKQTEDKLNYLIIK